MESSSCVGVFSWVADPIRAQDAGRTDYRVILTIGLPAQVVDNEQTVRHRDAAIDPHSMFGDLKSKSAGATAFLALMLTVLALIRSWGACSPLGEDFYVHWCVAHSISDESFGDIYSDEGRTKIGTAYRNRVVTEGSAGPLQQLTNAHPQPQAVATPFLYWVFSNLITSDYERDYLLHKILSILCTILAIVVFARALRFSWTAVFLAICLLTEPFEPFLSIQRTGNVSQFQLGLLALFLLVQGGSRNVLRTLVSGVLLGIAVAFKPNLAIPLLLVLALRLSRRQFVSAGVFAIGSISGALGAVTVSANSFAAAGCWEAWYAKIQNFLDNPPSVSQGNYAISNLFEATAGIHTASTIMIVLGVIVLALLWIRSRGVDPNDTADAEQNRSDDFLVVSLGCAITLLSAPVAWLHYYNLAIPLALYCIWPARHGTAAGNPPVLRGLLATICLFVMALTPAILTLDANWQNPALYAQLCYWPCVVLFGLGCMEMARAPRVLATSE